MAKYNKNAQVNKKDAQEKRKSLIQIGAMAMCVVMVLTTLASVFIGLLYM